MIINRETYLLTVIPPLEVIKYVDGFRRKYAENMVGHISPHITILPNFYNGLSSELALKESLSKACSRCQSFRVSLNDVDFFEDKNNVAFFKPDDDSTVLLRDLMAKTITKMNGKIVNKYDDYPTDPKKFIPHMTIAEHISDSEFSKIKNELAQLSVDEKFEVNSVVLLKNEQGSWRPIYEIRF